LIHLSSNETIEVKTRSEHSLIED